MDQQPPSYDATIAAERDQLLSLASKTYKSEITSPFGDAFAHSVCRLRNFLCYVLHVDYAAGVAEYPITLPAADANHFRGVLSILTRYLHTLDATAADDADKAQLAAFFWENVHAPARAIGLPSEAAISAISRFGTYQTNSGAYKGCVLGIMHNFGMRVLAGKLHLDAQTVIPLVAPNQLVEEDLRRALEKTQTRWFKRLDGFDFEAGQRTEAEGGSFYHSNFNAFELTDEGTRFEARQFEALKIRRAAEKAQPSEARRGGVRGLWKKEKNEKKKKTGDGSFCKSLLVYAEECIERMEAKARRNRLHRSLKWPLMHTAPVEIPPWVIPALVRPVGCANPNFFMDKPGRCNNGA